MLNLLSYTSKSCFKILSRESIVKYQIGLFDIENYKTCSLPNFSEKVVSSSLSDCAACKLNLPPKIN